MHSPSEFLAQHKQALLLIIGTSQPPLDKIDERTLLITKGSTSFQPTSLMQWLAEQLELRFPERETSQKESLNYFLDQIAQRNKKFLLIIESAHQLPFATLAALSHLAIRQEQTRIIMPVFLTGNQSLINKAQALQLAEVPWIEVNDAYPLDEAPKAANEPFLKRHGIKTFSVAALTVLGLGMHYFRNHPVHSTPTEFAAIHPPQLANKVIALGPDVILREDKTKHEDNYTIQLAAADNYKSAATFIAKNHLKNATIHLKEEKNKNWFVVNYGDYATPTAALNAEKKLPGNLLKHNPWVTRHTT